MFPRYDDRPDRARRAFVTWRPTPVQIAVDDDSRRAGTLPVTVSDGKPAEVAPASRTGRLLFADRMTHQGSPAIDIDVPGDGTPVTVWVGGRWPSASTRYADVSVVVRERSGARRRLGSHPTMVRVRKDANTLTAYERNRFLRALATLNGSGAFAAFREMHVLGAPDDEAHGGAAFLAWHRAYLLDLERELQSIDGEVTLPYWRFDRAAPNLFTGAFLGVGGPTLKVALSPTNPLNSWSTDGDVGIQRGGNVGPTVVPPSITQPSILTEQQTVDLSIGPSAAFRAFRAMQGNPHGLAHTCHGAGWIRGIGTAAKDPLFFLLHCNVDRLWAKWQWAAQRHDPAVAASFDSLPQPLGHRLADTMWPWSGPLAAPRPTFAPGGDLRASPMTPAPGAKPRVRDMIDYLGTVSPEPLGFAYDDVPFQLTGGGP